MHHLPVGEVSVKQKNESDSGLTGLGVVGDVLLIVGSDMTCEND